MLPQSYRNCNKCFVSIGIRSTAPTGQRRIRSCLQGKMPAYTSRRGHQNGNETATLHM